MDVLEVARFSTLPEAELAVTLLRRHDIDARLPDRDMATMNPDMLIALGGVRVIASSQKIAEARRLIARMRAGEFADAAEISGDWMIDHTPGRVGELDEAEVHGVMRHAKKAGVVVVVLFFVVFPLAGCVMLALGY
ncbi:MAG: hypothetical protein DCF29_07555 [Alphaproteobacteria bacterium]|nr:MAG: hypothetical protein DCF29_07555 [Alphaproteobacteria bacterium]